MSYTHDYQTVKYNKPSGYVKPSSKSKSKKWALPNDKQYRVYAPASATNTAQCFDSIKKALLYRASITGVGRVLLQTGIFNGKRYIRYQAIQLQAVSHPEWDNVHWSN